MWHDLKSYTVLADKWHSCRMVEWKINERWGKNADYRFFRLWKANYISHYSNNSVPMHSSQKNQKTQKELIFPNKQPPWAEKNYKVIGKACLFTQYSSNLEC